MSNWFQWFYKNIVITWVLDVISFIYTCLYNFYLFIYLVKRRLNDFAVDVSWNQRLTILMNPSLGGTRGQKTLLAKVPLYARVTTSQSEKFAVKPPLSLLFSLFSHFFFFLPSYSIMTTMSFVCFFFHPLIVVCQRTLNSFCTYNFNRIIDDTSWNTKKNRKKRKK